MLGSEQPGEADAARRKLLEHLAHARLSLTDVSNRLGGAPAAASFLQGTREMSLERQLTIARHAKHEAEAEAAVARARVTELQQALQQSTLNVGRALRGQARGRNFAALGFCAAAISLMVAGGAQFGPIFGRDTHAGFSQPPVPALDATGDAAFHLGKGERLGTALVQDLAVRLAPNDSAGVRAFLNQGTRIAISGQDRVGLQTWLYIRSGSGFGWVRAGDVLH